MDIVGLWNKITSWPAGEFQDFNNTNDYRKFFWLRNKTAENGNGCQIRDAVHANSTFTYIPIPKPMQQLYISRIPREAFGDEKFDTRKSPNTVKNQHKWALTFKARGHSSHCSNNEEDNRVDKQKQSPCHCSEISTHEGKVSLINSLRHSFTTHVALTIIRRQLCRKRLEETGTYRILGHMWFALCISDISAYVGERWSCRGVIIPTFF